MASELAGGKAAGLPASSPEEVQGVSKSLPTRLATEVFLEELWPVFLAAMEDGLTINDAAGRYLYVSSSFCRISGHAEHELIGQVDPRLLPREEEACVGGVTSLASGPEHGQISNVQVRRKDGSLATFNLRYVRLEIEGEVLHAFIVRDVTEQKELEQQLLHADRMRALGTLAGGVAHEFNNLLVSILGYAEMIGDLQPFDREMARDYARKIQRAARRGTQLTGQLLPFARRVELHKEPVNLHEILREVADLFRSSVGSSIRVQLDLGARSAWVRGNGMQLQQVFLNLFFNARDAMADGGELLLETEDAEENPSSAGGACPEAGAWLIVRVCDNGTGMSEEILRRAFEPFFTTKDAGKGNGLGLALVYSAVENHGGEVRLESSPGNGCTVTIWLPRA